MATANINGIVWTVSVAELRELMGVSNAAAVKAIAAPAKAIAAPAKAAPVKTAAEKTAKLRAAADEHLASAKIQRMVKNAVEKFDKAGFAVTPKNQGKWVWIYAQNGAGRTPEFQAVKLPKGWVYSKKRGAFYRDFSADC